MSATIHKTIVIDGVTYNLMRANETPEPKFKIGDWVKVVTNKTECIPEKNNHIGKVVKISRAFCRGAHIRPDNENLYSYDIGKTYVVYEDELEPAEEPKKSPFECEEGDRFYFVTTYGTVSDYTWKNDATDKKLTEVANCCKDEKRMKQRALHEILSRLLWQASEESGEADNPWDGNHEHYAIAHHEANDGFGIMALYRDHGFEPYFATEEAAQAAIDNIIRPFMKEHPEFKW